MCGCRVLVSKALGTAPWGQGTAPCPVSTPVPADPKILTDERHLVGLAEVASTRAGPGQPPLHPLNAPALLVAASSHPNGLTTCRTCRGRGNGEQRARLPALTFPGYRRTPDTELTAGVKSTSTLVLGVKIGNGGIRSV